MSHGQSAFDAAQELKALFPRKYELAVVLGSGFYPILENLQVIKEIPYSVIGNFPKSTVPGHAGKFVCAEVEDTPVLFLSGRLHYYEGHSMERVTFPVRVLAEAGIRHLLLTNAAGGIHPDLAPGDLMVVNDHINFMGDSPLRGILSSGIASPFVDLSNAYDRRMSELLVKAGRLVGLKMRTGIYLAVSGPHYETPAEIRVFRQAGADAVGMSTVPEVIVANHCSLPVAAVSCIANRCAGLNGSPLNHEDVLETVAGASEMISRFFSSFVRLYSN